jgi:hypothetical protein
MRKVSSVAAVALVSAVFCLPGGTAVAQVPQHHVTLTGAREAPGPGDKNGRGEFSWSLDGTRLCYLLTAKRIGTAAAAHIHRGKVGVAGPVKIELQAPNRASATCVTIDAGLASKLRDHTRKYYVNVHTAAFPNGAIRAQLTS